MAVWHELEVIGGETEVSCTVIDEYDAGVMPSLRPLTKDTIAQTLELVEHLPCLALLRSLYAGT